MTREDRAFNWLDRQVDRVTSDDYKARMLLNRSNSLIDRTEGFIQGVEDRRMQPKHATRLWRKREKDRKRVIELTKAISKGGKSATNDPVLGIRMKKVYKNMDLLGGQNKRLEKLSILSSK